MSKKNKITKIGDAQKFVKDFALRNGWRDEPNIDKFDHLHEELIEMSKLLRYKDLKERKKVIVDLRHEFEDGVGDLLFALLRLANQLGIDATSAFDVVKQRIVDKYGGKKLENKIKK